MTSGREPTESHASHPDFSSSDAREQQDIHLEMMHSEVGWLHEQVQRLRQMLLYQTQERHKIDQELQATHQDLALMNQEIQNLMRVNRLSFEEAQEFAQALVTQKKPTREALAQLLSVIYGRTVDSKDLGKTPSSACQAHSETSEEFTPPPQNILLPQWNQLRSRWVGEGLIR